jgi:prepilin-type processing-associated H-X9-DG protein
MRFVRACFRTVGVMKRRTFKVLASLAVTAAILGALIAPLCHFASQAQHHALAEGCARNLREIALAAVMYSSSHKGHWPDDLAQIVREEKLSPDTLVCPEGEETQAPHWSAPGAVTSGSLAGHLSYIYIGKGLVDPMPNDKRTVVAYERHISHGSYGMNVAFGDGHIEQLAPEDAKRFLAAVANAPMPMTWPLQPKAK